MPEWVNAQLNLNQEGQETEIARYCCLDQWADNDRVKAWIPSVRVETSSLRLK